ncbi:MAG: glycosyltransferase family 39 protein [Candidatus Levybacteria bacterium]|nr:glycosyltransferase family 39 protein [Candidatus Levybacteria bacterium]
MHSLEKSLQFWILTGILSLFFLMRLPSLFEPYWYGDEGIYEAIAFALNKGRILYLQIWDNKPPLLYYTYAIFNGDQFLVRLLSTLYGLLSVLFLYFLSRKIFPHKNTALISTAFFSLLFGLPILEGNIANAENFMLPFSILSGFLVYKNKSVDSKKLILPGLVLGISFLYKIVGIFDFAAFFLFILFMIFPENISIKKMWTSIAKYSKPLITFIASFLIPFAISVLFFLHNNALSDYLSAIFLSTVGYVGHNNVFIVPQGLLISKLFLLGIVVIVIFLNRQKIQRPLLFILLWLVFSIFNSFFSQRPYTHYLLVLLPSISLLVGAIFYADKAKKAQFIALFLLIGVITLMYFRHWSIKKTLDYYGNFITFVTEKKSVNEYEAFFDKNTVRDRSIISYLTSKNILENDLFIWGNSAQIYYLTKTLPPTKFTVAYHVENNKEYQDQLQKAIDEKKPRFIINIGDVPSPLKTMYNYNHVLKIGNADIYENLH